MLVFSNYCRQQTWRVTIPSMVLLCWWQLWVLSNESFGVNGATTGQKSRLKYYMIKWKKEKQEELFFFQDLKKKTARGLKPLELVAAVWLTAARFG